MKKFLIMAIAAFALSLTTQAQSYTNSRYYNERTGHLDYSRYSSSIGGHTPGENYYGLRLGPSFTTVSSDDPALDGGKSQTGLSFGAVAGFALSPSEPLYLEVGALYVEKGGKKKNDGKKNMTYDLNYLEMPFVVKYAIETDYDFSIQPFVGGYMACGIGGKVKNYREREAESSFSGNYFKRFDAGLRMGCGISYDIFYADLSYDLGLTNICHDDFDRSHNSCLSLNIGVNF